MANAELKKGMMKTETGWTVVSEDETDIIVTSKVVRKIISKEPGCAACGNPAYPACKISCPMFDD